MEEQISTDSNLDIPISEDKLKGFLKNIPKQPGVYKFLDENKCPIYIGKAKNLFNRVPSYFQENKGISIKTKSLAKLSKYLEFTLTNNELEALLLEQHLIKQNKPKFNVQFKDDKGYPWIKFDLSSRFPSAKPFNGKRKKDHHRYYGPYPSSLSLRNVLKIIQETFKLRNCTESFFKNRTRPCIQYEIGKCSAPCMGLITEKEYSKELISAELLLSGKSEKLIAGLYEHMDNLSQNKDYERAAVYRDKISALREIQRTQSIVGYSKQRDAICALTIDGQTNIGITRVNEGWVVGHENFTKNKISFEGNIIEEFIKMYYLKQTTCPPFIVVDEALEEKKLIEKALTERHGKKVKIISQPNKQDRGLLQICKSNTDQLMSKGESHKIKEATNALSSLEKELNLSKKIKNIESYDISHHSSSAAVGGCVVFSRKGKLKEKYRLFDISKENSGNDISSMVEVIERRFISDSVCLEKPCLILLDGGKPHISAVLKKLKEMSIEDITVISISKGVRRKALMDSIHLPDGSTKKITKGSIAHLFIQEVRDETHRFSISAQRRKQKKILFSSSLSGIVGIGKKRKETLIRFFGSVDQIRKASAQDLMEVPGIGRATAISIHNQLR